MERLDFTISNQIVLSFEIDHEQKTARLLPSTDPLATHVILTSEEKTYQGIERRLNEMQQTKKTLKAQLKDIQAKGFHAPMQHNLRVNNSSSSIKATIDAPVITLPSNFGNTNINGLQHKDNIQIDNIPHFVKLDSLSPAVNGTWKSDFNAQYSSVSEALTSILAKNIKNGDALNNVLYEWREFELNGQKVTGTISKNFLQAHEEEHVLAVDRKLDKHTHLSVKDYEENMYDAPTDVRIHNLTKAFSNIQARPEDIHQFLIQQAAFDMLVGNQDRLNNPSNFVFAYNVKDQTSRMVNLDYGRTLPLIWTQTTEKNYSVEEFLQEDLIDFADSLNSADNSILSGLSKKEALSFLNEHGFKQFELDMSGVSKDLDDLEARIKASSAPYKKFATCKIAAFKEMLQSDFSKNFYKEVTPEKTPVRSFDVLLGRLPAQESTDSSNYLSPASQQEDNNNIRPLVILSEKNGMYIAAQARSTECQSAVPRHALQESLQAGFIEDTSLTTNLEQLFYIEKEAVDFMTPLGRITKTDQEAFLKAFLKENQLQQNKQASTKTKQKNLELEL